MYKKDPTGRDANLRKRVSFRDGVKLQSTPEHPNYIVFRLVEKGRPREFLLTEGQPGTELILKLMGEVQLLQDLWADDQKRRRGGTQLLIKDLQIRDDAIALLRQELHEASKPKEKS